MGQQGLTRGGIVAAALMLGAGMAIADPVKIRASFIVPGTNFFSIYQAKAGLMTHLGKSYTLEATRYQATPPMITAMAVGELDIGLLNSTSLSLGVQNAGMQDLRVFADEFRDGVEGYSSNEFLVRADGPKTPAELKGKTVQTNAIGSMVDIASRLWLRKNGLEDKRDYNIVEAGLNTVKALMQEKKADLVAAVPPFLFDPELRKIARPMFTQRDALGASELGFWAAKDSFLKKNKDAVVDFLEDAMAVTRWLQDPANHDEAVKIVSEVTKAPPALFADWIYTKKDYYRDPNLIPDIVATQANVDAQSQLGFLQGKVDVKNYFDLSYVQEAGKRLK
jgi:sulfonate transport system substrate-binding protein